MKMGDRQHQEYHYLNLLADILQNGKKRDDRTGTGTLSTFGRQIRFDISNDIPLLTTKFVPWKACIKEMLWFLKGQTDANVLKEQGVKIWDGNTTREFLDKRGLTDLPEGDIGATYGFQWRHFGAQYKTCQDDYGEAGFDQIQYIINELKTNPYSRRIFMSSWNPAMMHRMCLPPCHVCCQFYVDIDDEGQKHLSAHMLMRSTDVCLGLPFNIFSYASLTYLIAKLTDMKPKDLVITTGDTHVYLDHVDAFKEQVQRHPYPFPKLVVSDRIKDVPIDDINISDFVIVGYEHHPAIKGNMSV